MSKDTMLDTGSGSIASRKAVRSSVLDPLSRASEILFGLIMVLTFTLSIGVTEAGRDDVRAMLIGVIGCNLAWGLIDAALYLMNVRGERGLAASAIAAIRHEENPSAGRALVADYLPPEVLPALAETEIERIRTHLKTLPPDTMQQGVGREDRLAALGVFLFVFLCLFPVVIPFLIFDDIRFALRASNVVAIVLLFLTGFSFGRHVGRPWRTGMVTVLVGIVLVAIAMALGG
jgi:hypothetical protein